MHTELIFTEDGSHTLFVPELNEHFHSIHGAIQESLHVFIEAGLKSISNSKIKILEIGFGTGLNALLTLHYGSNNNLNIEYHSVEFYPISLNKIEQLNYTDFFPLRYIELFRLMHICAWNSLVEIEENFSLKKINASFIDFTANDKYDLIYFDAFGPDKQPEMWSEKLMQKLFDCLNESGILTTYSAKGQVKRNLKNAGFEIELIPGPPGKREMIRAIKPKN
ncbi:MAG: tRNA (5-methylaminomethyl-2-thiouridine)(34)-methyltransferase MnmD [Bacteroidales bacterium]|nr:tRNA (5-methylaminomethyl-2-thiouridine)(34)-methyltransferase MnmD [Bacteroidales bacterium]